MDTVGDLDASRNLLPNFKIMLLHFWTVLHLNPSRILKSELLKFKERNALEGKAEAFSEIFLRN